MSLRTLLDRRVTLTSPAAPADPPVLDAFGNRVTSPATPIANVPARRDQIAQDENLAARDEQTRTYLYILALRNETGTPVAITGRSTIDDVDDAGHAQRLQVLGDPELVHRRRRPHHWEARARKVEG